MNILRPHILPRCHYWFLQKSNKRNTVIFQYSKTTQKDKDGLSKDQRRERDAKAMQGKKTLLLGQTPAQKVIASLVPRFFSLEMSFDVVV
jgi:hypothetical protein